MSIRTILAPGVQINEIDKSQYSPAMTGSNCYVMGFTNKGEPYTPMEFTSRTAWTNYYGTPDNEAERYAYSAACEVLNQGGRLYFARLPYDNPAFKKVTCFKWNVKTGRTLSASKDDFQGTPFHEVVEADSSIKDVAAIEPTEKPVIYDLSAIDEFRTGEAAVGNNTFVIADIAFNTYDRIPEDDRKNEKREMVGILPVVTTAANALYAQKLINVDKENVIGFETIGKIRTLDATQLSDSFPETSALASLELRSADMCMPLNTSEHYVEVTSIPLLSATAVTVTTGLDSLSSLSEDKLNDEMREKIENYIGTVLSGVNFVEPWNGRFQIDFKYNNDSELSGLSAIQAGFSFKANFTSAQLSVDANTSAAYKIEYAPRFGWHNPDGDDDVPDTLSRSANEFFPTITTFQDSSGTMRFDRDHMKKIGVVVYKMFVDPSENNKVNFEPVEAYAGSLGRNDKDPTTGVTTFIDTIINSQSKYINFFSNCFNTPTGKKYYNDELDMLVVQPCTLRNPGIEMVIDKVEDFKNTVNQARDIVHLGEVDYKTIDEAYDGMVDLVK